MMREWSSRVDGLFMGLPHSFGASDKLHCAWIGFRSLPTCAAHEDLPYLAGRAGHVESEEVRGNGYDMARAGLEGVL